MNAVVRFEEMQLMAASVAKGGLFGVKTPDQAISLMLLCQAEGLHPMTAVSQYHIIQGRPALKSDALLARFQQAGGKVEWPVYQDDKVTGRFSHPQGGTLEVTWTMKDAARAGLANKEVWRQYPRSMLRARVLAEGIRTVYPGVMAGTYTVEEVRDFGPGPAAAPHIPHSLPGRDQEGDDLNAIATAADMDALKAAFTSAYKLARAANDEEGIARLEEAKNRRKAELEAITVESANG